MRPHHIFSSSTPNTTCRLQGETWAMAGQRAVEVEQTATQLSSHSIRPRPGRRRSYRLLSHRTTSLFGQIFFIVIALVSTLGTTVEAAVHRDEYFRKSEFAQFARRGEILVDRRPPPRAGFQILDARQNGDPFGASSTSTSTASSVAATTSSQSTSIPTEPSITVISIVNSVSASPSSSLSSTQTSMTQASSATNSPLPSPFDTSIGSNFTSPSCPSFFKTFLNNATFSSCLPFSLLLQNSNSFFMASHSITRITQTLDATCHVDFSTCSSLMSSLADQLRSDQNCGQDYTNENPIVRQAYNGFIAYSPLYQAACLKDSSGSYCYADAITNTSSPTDSYVYFLPLGISLPGGSRPTCSTCLKQTMAIFAESAGNLSQPISTDYSTAATQIDAGCGPNFVNASVTPIQGSAKSGTEGMKGMVQGLPLILGIIGAFLLLF